MSLDLSKVEVPITDKETGEVRREPLNINGPQSDGTYWTAPKDLVDPNHEHYFKLKSPGDREAICDCGFGGQIYPHNADLIDGHVYNKQGKKII